MSLFNSLSSSTYQRIDSFLSNRDAFSFFMSQKQVARSTGEAMLYREKLSRSYYENFSPKRLHEAIFQGNSLEDMDAFEPLCIPPKLRFRELEKRNPIVNISPFSLAAASKEVKCIDQYITRIKQEIEPSLQIPHIEIGDTAYLLAGMISKISNKSSKQRIDRWLYALDILAHYQHEDKLIEIFEYYESLPKAKDSYAEIIVIDSLKYLIFCAASLGKFETIAFYWGILEKKLYSLTFLTSDEQKFNLLTSLRSCSKADRVEKERNYTLYMMPRTVILQAISYGNITPEQLCILTSILDTSLEYRDSTEDFYENLYMKLLRPFNSDDLKKSGQFSSFMTQLNSLWNMVPIICQPFQIVGGFKATAKNGDLTLTQWLYEKLQKYLAYLTTDYLSEDLVDVDIEDLFDVHIEYPEYLEIGAYFGYSEIVDFFIRIMSTCPEFLMTEAQLLALFLPHILLNALLGGQKALIEKYFGSDSNFDSFLFSSDIKLNLLSTLFYNNQWDILQYLFKRIIDKERLLDLLNQILLDCLTTCALSFKNDTEKFFGSGKRYLLERDWLFEAIEKLYDLSLEENAIHFRRMKDVITQSRERANPLLAEGLSNLLVKIERMEQSQPSVSQRI